MPSGRTKTVSPAQYSPSLLTPRDPVSSHKPLAQKDFAPYEAAESWSFHSADGRNRDRNPLLEKSGQLLLAAIPSEAIVRALCRVRRMLLYSKKMIFDPSSETGDFAFAEFPAPRMAWALDETGMEGFAMLADGRLVRFSALTGRILGEAAGVTGAYSMERGVIRPMMAVAGHRVAVSDPAIGVGVADTPEGLSALHHPGCAAAIWRRQPLPGFQS